MRYFSMEQHITRMIPRKETSTNWITLAILRGGGGGGISLCTYLAYYAINPVFL